MFYATNSKGYVVYRNKDRNRVVAQANAIAKTSGIQLTVTDKSPRTKTQYVSVLPYNDPIEQII